MAKMDEAVKKWNKSFKRKMMDNEEVMFRWGYAYAIDDFKGD